MARTYEISIGSNDFRIEQDRESGKNIFTILDSSYYAYLSDDDLIELGVILQDYGKRQRATKSSGRYK